jgi:peptidoglycan/LPS O-acetylase OafA/YrhL
LVDRQNNFDLLRLVAALSVILSHAFLLAENSQDHDPLIVVTDGQAILGLAGVFVFFTVSGYLVSQSFATTRSPVVFLAKRALRIFPGLIVCLLVCAFVIGPLVTQLPLADYLTRPETWLFLLHNGVLDVEYNRLPGVAFSTVGIGHVVNGPLWSLPCEALLYFMLFGLGICRCLRLPIIAALIALGMVCLWYDTANNDALGTLGAAGWLLGFFAVGMAGYRLGPAHIVDRRWAIFAALALLLSVPAHLFLIMFPVCGGYLVLHAALSRRWSPIPAARFGDLSYGLYIYGWPIEQSVVYFSNGAASWWQVFLIATALAVPIAFLSWHLVEKRCRWRTRRSPNLALAASAAAD